MQPGVAGDPGGGSPPGRATYIYSFLYDLYGILWGNFGGCLGVVRRLFGACLGVVWGVVWGLFAQHFW